MVNEIKNKNKINITTEKNFKFFVDCLVKSTNDFPTILLSGLPGSGKTHLARAIIEQIFLNIKIFTPSPTYSLMHEYVLDKSLPLFQKYDSVIHVDLFKLKNEENPRERIKNLGLFHKLEENICIIEWPEEIKKVIIKYIEVYLYNDYPKSLNKKKYMANISFITE